MKLNKKYLAMGLAINFAFLGLINPSNTSYASNINKNSSFYRSAKTRSAYLALSDSQRVELDRMNTDNKSPLKIEEVLETKRYSLPIVKGKDWLYPFMIDRNNDGQVGENYFKYDNTSNSNTKPGKTDQSKDESTGKYGLIDNTPAKENPVKEDTKKEEITDKNPQNPESENSSDLVSESENIKSDLKKSIDEAKNQVDAAEYLLEELPFTVANVKDKLISLLDQTKEFIKEAEELLETL